MENSSTTPKQQYHASRIIAISLILGLFGAGAAGVLVSELEFNAETRSDDIGLIIAASLTAIAVPLSYILSLRIWRKMPLQSGLMEKLKVFQTGMVIRFAILEAAGLASFMILMESRNSYMVFFMGAIIMIMLFNIPNKNKLVMYGGLREDELRQL